MCLAAHIKDLLNRYVFVEATCRLGGAFLQRIQGFVQRANPLRCLSRFWEERDVHGCKAFLEGGARKTPFRVRVVGIWRSIVASPRVAQRLCRHISNNVSEALRDRALEVDVHYGSAAAIVYEERTKYS